jgi:hypothetical protein
MPPPPLAAAPLVAVDPHRECLLARAIRPNIAMADDALPSHGAPTLTQPVSASSFCWVRHGGEGPTGTSYFVRLGE